MSKKKKRKSSKDHYCYIVFDFWLLSEIVTELVRLTDSSLVVSVSYWILESLRHHEARSRTGNVVWKMNLHFTIVSRDTSKSFTVKTIAKLNLERSSKFETQIWKINRRGLRSPDNAKCGHFTLRRQRERHQTKGLISKTIAVHLRYKSLYISFQFSAKQQREMTKFCVIYGTRTMTA